MKIASDNYNSQSFKALNFRNTCTFDRENIIRKGFRELKKLGEQYDIYMLSCYTDAPGQLAIEIDVRPLRKGMGFIKSLFRPVGRSTFFADSVEVQKSNWDKDSFIKSVHGAIADLKEKISKKL